ncbi:hypothetical protein F935_01795 [Acinetobacter calcoaceticus ANC 3811]|uniref:3-hydroxybutyrate dehydrogenase n=1 Tax=Acinetobacter calcoaceticus ANC 3811 TaxID=1217690 RepID=R8Y0U2_ACICA|nr:SDR family oxidoreductase [Acinetobacter calcoaceticus]EOQ62706.1 hypothetical protein F935_01795 [Acinetobacter calcoaceticus ANC 3811]
MSKKPDFSNKVVLITGGGRGIGLATAFAFRKLGAKVAIGDIDLELATQAAFKVQGYGGYLDVRLQKSFHEFVEQVEKELGPIDILINNAGIMPMGSMIEETQAITDAQIDINLRGVIHGMKAVLPKMLERQTGHIVNVASLAGKYPIPGASIYCATKFAVVGLTSAMQQELRDTPIGVSAVLPSKVTTELSSGTGDGLPIPTVEPQEVADAIIKAVEHKISEIAVPNYLTHTPKAYGLIPFWLNTGFRKLIGDDRILKGLDQNNRKSYIQRLNQLAQSK